MLLGQILLLVRPNQVVPELAAVSSGLVLSRVLRKLKLFDAAIEAAISAGDSNPQALHQLGLCYLDVQNYRDAAAAFRRAATFDPSAPVIKHGLGLALKGLGDHSGATEAFRSAGNYPPSLAALASQRPGPQSDLLEAKRLIDLNFRDQALAAFERARTVLPNDAESLELAGAICQGLGRFEEASELFLKAISINPKAGSAYYGWTQSRRVAAADQPMIDRMHKLLEEGGLPLSDSSQLHYALAKSLEDLGDFQPAAAEYQTANRDTREVKFNGRRFGKETHRMRIDHALHTFDHVAAKPIETEVPIFVVGMLRSGTTLLDQILSAHPRVASSGEVPLLLEKLDPSTFDPARLEEIGRTYLAHLNRLSKGKPRVVDKMPDNYLLLPALATLFPGARLVHIKRDPADTCLSIYTTVNRLPIEWLHDLDSIAFVYEQYLRVMNRWREVLPPGRLIEVQYEELVSDPEPVVRRLLESCGLEWSDRCLSPETNPNSVATPSVWQSRQRVNVGSVGRAKRFEPWLKVPVITDFREIDQALAEGRSEEAESLCLASGSESQEGLVRLGMARLQLGRFSEAVSALSMIADTAEVLLLLSVAHTGLGDTAKALELAREAARLEPNNAFAHDQLGRLLLEAGRFPDAEFTFQRAAFLAPAASFGHEGLARTLQAQGKAEQAVATLRKAVASVPYSLPLRFSLIEALLQVPDAPAARHEAAALPESAGSQILLARSLSLLDRAEEAGAAVDKAVELGLITGPAAYQAAAVLQGLGRLSEAGDLFKLSLELDPHQGAAFAYLSYLRKTTEADRPLLTQMETLSTAEPLPAVQRSLVYYGLGRSFEDLGEFERSMEFYDQANSWAVISKFGGSAFHRHEMTASHDLLREEFAYEFGKMRRLSGSHSDAPIFIVGMIRSGTTLVDQILSSHRRVRSVGEDPFWLDYSRSFLGMPRKERTSKDLHDATRRYLAHALEDAEGRVVNKMPMNYAIVPLIHLAFPSAKIVHVLRDPLDTCLSIYTTINQARIEWTHDKSDIVFAYREYQRLMSTWTSLLPPGSLMELPYERLVSEPEPAIRGLLEFCALDWDEAVLTPHLNPRTVTTPSVWQVRQPIYRTSVARWQKFEPWLGDLLSLRS